MKSLFILLTYTTPSCMCKIYLYDVVQSTLLKTKRRFCGPFFLIFFFLCVLLETKRKILELIIKYKANDDEENNALNAIVKRDTKQKGICISEMLNWCLTRQQNILNPLFVLLGVKMFGGDF